MIEPSVERLAWDSSFFGFEVGRLHVSACMNQNRIIEAIVDSGCRCVYVYIPHEQASRCGESEFECARHVLASAGMKCYDIRTSYSKQIDNADLRNGVFTADEITPELEDIAIASGVHSRFLKDERLRPYFRGLYLEWLKKDFQQGGVFVHRGIKGPDGILTVSNEGGTGRIGLLAVDSKSRRTGVATSLLRNADSWMCARGVGHVEVCTQGENAEARHLYEKSGFSMTAQTEVWHVWVDF